MCDVQAHPHDFRGSVLLSCDGGRYRHIQPTICGQSLFNYFFVSFLISILWLSLSGDYVPASPLPQSFRSTIWIVDGYRPITISWRMPTVTLLNAASRDTTQISPRDFPFASPDSPSTLRVIDDLPTRNESPRRSFLRSGITCATTALGVITSTATVAHGAAPITLAEIESPIAQIQRQQRQKPPKILRNYLNQDFGILLMRSSYIVLDQLDCVSMDQFQRDFFLVRQAEYKPYINQVGQGVVHQGQLTDPYYFDFISYVQYRTMNREITQNPPMIFEEQQSIEDTTDSDSYSAPNGSPSPKQVTRVVQRDPLIRNDLLASEHRRRVGSYILTKFDELFAGTPSALPTGVSDGEARANSAQVLEALSQLVKLFLINGFAMNGSAALIRAPTYAGSATGSKFLMTLDSPATLWGGRALVQEKSILKNDYLLKTAEVLAKRLGYDSTSKVEYDGLLEKSVITLQ